MTSSTPSLSPNEIAELQQTEIEAIESILDHDFTRVEQKAWKGAASSQLHEFQVVIRPDEDRLKSLVCAHVGFRLPKNYPLVPPTILVKQSDGRHKGLSATHINKLSDELDINYPRVSLKMTGALDRITDSNDPIGVEVEGRIEFDPNAAPGKERGEAVTL